jgi:hypothetical protein
MESRYEKAVGLLQKVGTTEIRDKSFTNLVRNILMM